MRRARIGLVGFGYIGRYVYEQVSSRPELGLEVSGVFTLNSTLAAISRAKGSGRAMQVC